VFDATVITPTNIDVTGNVENFDILGGKTSAEQPRLVQEPHSEFTIPVLFNRHRPRTQV